MSLDIEITERPHQPAEAGPTLRARQDLLFAETREGVLVRWGTNGYVLKGRTAYRWLSTVLPLLDGTHTLAELVEGLDEGRAASVRQIVRSLVERGVVQAGTVHAAGRTQEDRGLGDQLAYAAHVVPDADAAMARVGSATVHVVGDGPVADSCVAALVANGFDHVVCEPATAAAGTVTEEVDRARGRSRDPRVETAVPGTPATLTLVLPTGTADDVERAGADGGAVVPVQVSGTTVLVGPLATGEAVGATADDAWQRYLAGAPAAEAAEAWRRRSRGEAVTDLPGSPLAWGLLGNLLAFEVFKHVTGAGAECHGRVVVFDLETTVGVAEPLLALPTRLVPEDDREVLAGGVAPEAAAAPASAPAGARPTIAAGAQPPTSDQVWKERLETGWEPLLGRRTGVVPDYDDLEIVQAPVKIGRVLLADPWRPGDVARVAGWSAGTIADARDAAIRRAMCRYAGSVAPHLVGPTVPARDLGTGASARLDRAVALAGAGALATGTAAGRSGARARDGAVAAARSAFALAALADGTARGAGRLDLAAGPDHRTGFLLEVATTLGLDVRAWATSWPGGAVSVAVAGARPGSDGTVRLDLCAAATAVDPVDAVHEALLEVVARAQAADQGQDLGDPGPGAAPVAGAALDRTTAPWTPAPTADAGALASPQALAADGLRALQVDLTPDDLATATGVTITRVVLLEA